jgi:hypothetical protein
MAIQTPDDSPQSPKRIRWIVLAISSCVAVLLATSSQAQASTGWKIVASPNVAGSIQSRLNGISCASSTSCIAVGYALTPVSEPPLIEKLSKGTWKIVPSPSIYPATLNSLSCITSTTCVAVGWESSPSGESTFIMQLSNGTWKSVSSPNPTGEVANTLQAVSCTTSTTCTAVGYSQTPYPATFVTLVETLSGGIWTVVPSPNAATSPSSNLNGVSCVDASNCVAVGQSDDSSGDHTLVEELSAGIWSVVPAPDVIALISVSCTSATTCVAVGSGGVEQLVGGAWQIMLNPNPGILISVSCTTSANCTAVGETGGVTSTLVERLSGGVWALLPSPNVAGVPTSVLLGVSCHRSTCNAAGFSQALPSGTVSTLIERN